MNSIFAMALRHSRWAACIPLLFCSLVYAAPNVIANVGTVNDLPPNLGYEYPLHSEPTVALFQGTTITSNTSAATTSADFNNVPGWPGIGGYRLSYESVVPAVIGVTLPRAVMNSDVSYGGAYQVFETGVDGVGFIVAGKGRVNDFGFRTSDFVSMDVASGIRRIHTLSTQCLGDGFSCIGANTFEMTVKVALVKIPRTSLSPATAPNGSISRNVKIGEFVIEKSNGSTSNPRPGELRTPVFINFTIDLKPRTCAILPAQADQTILLPVVTVAKMNAAPAQRFEPPQTAAQFNLSCQAPSYGPAITVYATLSDLINTANNNGSNTVLGIEAGASRATGMGIEMMRGGDAVATPLTIENRKKGSLGQWALTPYGSNTSLTLRARYVRTGPITPGIVRSRAAITFSYQ